MGVDFMARSMKSCKNSESRKRLDGSLSPTDDREDRKIITEEEKSNSWDRESKGGGPENPDQSSSDPGRISFLTVPSNDSSRRPSTADVVIEKLQVEKEDEGGLTISGVALGANCHLTLIIFGTFFVLAGIVLSYVAFATPKDITTDEPNAVEAQASEGGTSGPEFEPTEHHYQMQIIGPIFLAGGMFMICIGISLYAISRKISRDDMERRLVLSTVQLEQLENDFCSQSQSHIMPSPLHTTAPAQNQIYPVLSLRRGSLWMEPTPVEHPQTPSEALINSEMSSPFPYGIRSVSPLLNNHMVLSQQASQYSQYDLLHNLQASVYPQYQSLSTKRLSSPFINAFYGESEGTSDIATFPPEDIGSSCFPGKSNSTEHHQIHKKKISEKGSKADQLPQVFEVVEASSECASVVSVDAYSKNNDNDNPQSASSLTVSNVPEIQVTGPSPGMSRNTSANSEASLTNNFPALNSSLPRHSRHSISRADSAYPSRPGTSISSKFQPLSQDR